MRVIRESPLVVMGNPLGPTRMVRNLSNWKGRPPRPIRVWQNRMGKPDSIHTLAAINASAGAVTSRARIAIQQSKALCHADRASPTVLVSVAGIALGKFAGGRNRKDMGRHAPSLGLVVILP